MVFFKEEVGNGPYLKLQEDQIATTLNYKVQRTEERISVDNKD